MRTLKYAILGLLNQGELSGYDISSQFKEELGQFWSAKHSQIYPELKKLTAEGFIEYRVVIQGTKLEKKVYSITELGESELHDWLTTLKPVPTTTKDEFMLKTYFAMSMTPEEANHLFEDQIVKRQEKLKNLLKKLHDLEQAKEKPWSFSSNQIGHYLVLTRAIEREKGYIAWLEKVLQLFN